MNYQTFQKKQAKRLHILAHIILLITLLLTLLQWVFGVSYLEDSDGMQALITGLIFSIILYGFSSITGNLARRDLKKVNLSRNSSSIFDMGRIIFVSEIHWLKRFHFFALDGEQVAFVEEQIDKKQYRLRFLLNVIGLKTLLPSSYRLLLDQRFDLTLVQKAGFAKPITLIDQSGKKMASFLPNRKNLFKLDVHIEVNGENVAAIDGGMGGYEFRVTSNEKQWMFVRVGGVPTEAMELFAEGGNIVDISTDLKENEKVISLAALVAIHLLYNIKQ